MINHKRRMKLKELEVIINKQQKHFKSFFENLQRDNLSRSKSFLNMSAGQHVEMLKILDEAIEMKE